MTTPRRRTAGAAAAAALALALSGCSAMVSPTASPTRSATPSGPEVCAGLLPLQDVAAVLPPGKPDIREQQQPGDLYPLARCEVQVQDRTFTGSAYIFNMAGQDLAQLAGLTTADSAPLGGVFGMAGSTKAWLVHTCKLKGIDGAVPLLVQAKVTGPVEGTVDQRAALARLATTLAAKVGEAANCGTPAPVQPPVPAPASPQEPLADAPACFTVDRRALGPAAAQGVWTSQLTPLGAGPVQVCDLFRDGQRVLSFSVSHGWIVPSTEEVGERPKMTARLNTSTEPYAQGDPGAVLASVDGTCGDEKIGAAFRLAQHGDITGVPVESLFRDYVSKIQNCTPGDSWKFAPATP